MRTATPADAPAVGRLSVDAWRAGYADLMPADALAALDVEQRTAYWHEVLSGDLGRRHVVVAESPGSPAPAGSPEGVVGFAAFGPEAAAEPTVRGELYALNVDPHRWGGGVGTALLSAVQQTLVADGYPEAVLWVLPGNARARALYERHGWVTEPVVQDIDVMGVQVTVQRLRRPLA